MDQDREEDNFQNYIRLNSRLRLEAHYKELIEGMIDRAKVQESEKKLHPGF